MGMGIVNLLLKRLDHVSRCPSPIGHERLTEDLANLQKVLITVSAGYDRYSDRHTMCSRECRNIDDRHMNTLQGVS